MVKTSSYLQETDVRALPNAHAAWRTRYFMPTSMDVVGHCLVPCARQCHLECGTMEMCLTCSKLSSNLRSLGMNFCC